MTLRIYPEGEVEGATPASKHSWDSPGADEITAALEKSGMTFGEEQKPKEPEPTAGETTPEATPTPEKPEEKPAEEPEETAAEVRELKPGEKILWKGVEYTAEEFEEGIRGGLRTADYTRKTQELARQRDELELREHELVARARVATDSPEKGKPTKDEIAEILDDPDVPEATRRAILAVREENRRVVRMIQERDQKEAAVRQEREIEAAVNQYETVFSDLCTKHKVTDPIERKLLHATVLEEAMEQDPETGDADELRTVVGRIFEHAHKALGQRIEKAAKEAAAGAIAGLKKLPVPPSAKGGSTVPLKPEAKPAPTLDDGSAVGEFMERIDRLRGMG